MRLCIIVVLAFACLSVSADSWIRLHGKGKIIPGEKSASVNWNSYATWGPEAERDRQITFNIYAPKNDQWVDFSLSFTMVEEGWVTINLMGPWKKTGEQLERIDVVFSGLECKGAELKNGTFDHVADNVPGWWNMHKSGDASAAPFCIKEGVAVWHNGFFNQMILVKKDTVVTLKGRTRMAAPADYEGQKQALNDEKYRDAADVPLSLAKVANMGFTDEKEGDGEGGWSDQGPENDMAGFPVKRSNFGGVSFRIADPAENRGKSVVSFNLPNNKARLDRVFLSCPEPVEARWLYLLHTSCFNQSPGRIGRIKVTLDGGQEKEFDVLTGRDVADWWNAGKIANGSVVYRKQNPSASVGIYLSRFPLGDVPVKVKSVELSSDAIPVWIVAGATLSLRNAPEIANERLVIRADGVWKSIDMTKMSVIPGSALDLGSLHEPGPAGKYGRAVIGKDGNFAFEKRPDKPVRFFAFNAFANHLMTWKESMLLADTPEKTRANLKEFAAKVRRQGYNMVRFQGVDLLLMSGSPGYAKFGPSSLDHFQYLLFCLKEEGIYFGIDLFSYTGYEKFESQWNDAIAKRYKERMYFDPEARRMWLDGVKALMTVKNPHTGLSLNEEPALVYVDMHNEQELGIWAANKPLSMGGVAPLAEKAYRDFLSGRYGNDVKALEKSWNASFGSFNAVPLFTKSDLYADSARGKDANDFLYGCEKEMLDFYRAGLDAIGCKTFATLYDVLGYFRFTSIRRDVAVITSHGYHNHPTDNNRPGSRMAQNSINSTGALYFRYRSSMRMWNRPFLITEYNAPFWGKYRHQEGLILPAYAALQNYAGITAHSLAVSRLSVPLEDFQIGRDPIGRAGQVIAAFAYGRGDVGAAKHKVGVALSETYMRDHRNMNRGVGAEQNRLALLTGFGVELDGKIPSGLPAYPALDWLMPPAGGSEIVAQSMFATPMDRSGAPDFAGIVKTLRDKKILPPANRTDAAAGIFQSDTGEILLDVKGNRFCVDTPNLRGAAWEGGDIRLTGIALKSSLPCTAALASLDGARIGESRRMLLVFSTDALNSGMELAADRSVLYKLGSLPVLLETGKLELTLTESPALRCFALGIDGERLEELPVERAGKGLKISIDTAKLAKGPSVYFEFIQ